jgi:hypothetical protein
VQARRVVVGGIRYEHALVIGLDPPPSQKATSTLELRLGRAYRQFRAIAAREDRDADEGAAGAVFEVWGDGALLFKSDMLRPVAPRQVMSKATQVRRTAWQAVEVSVWNIALLQLVVHGAATGSGEAVSGGRARGCVWLLARVVPLSQAEADTEANRPRRAVRAIVSGVG